MPARNDIASLQKARDEAYEAYAQAAAKLDEAEVAAAAESAPAEEAAPAPAPETGAE